MQDQEEIPVMPQEVVSGNQTEPEITDELKNKEETNKTTETENTSVIDSKLDGILARIEELDKSINSSLSRAVIQNEMFDKMYEELAAYKKDLYAKIIKPFVMEAVSLMNDYERMLDKIDDLSRDELVKYLKNVPDDINQLLYINGVERFSEDSKKFNPKTQQVLRTEFVADEAQNNMVAATIRKGYIWNGSVIKPEMVKIFKYKQGLSSELQNQEN